MAEHGALATLKDLAEKEVEDAARLLGEMRRGVSAGGRTAQNADRLSE
ncbi:flagellar protein FliJ [Escherichia coli]|uniref:Flagellar protein FliJ n=1 Tax=Escherichia coli TaxID=562 RepID=A0A2X3JJ53_ECOLX|nr:flagellar protein FliJ [Escherichia coli]